MSVSNGQAANAATFNGAFVSKTANSTTNGVLTQEKESVLKEIATPTTPGSGYGKIYFKSDGKLYQLNDSGIETQVGSGSGGSGGINYISNGGAEDNNTTGWAVYADAAGTSPVDGTGGTANVTISATGTTPLIGTYSFLMAKDAVNRQGQGWSYDFTIDTAYRAKVLQISFDYLVSSGTFVAGTPSADSDVTVWIYDVTNANIIQPSNYKLLGNSSSLTTRYSATFQSASNSSSYRLIFHVGSTSASAYTLKVDGISVSPSVYVYGTPITDWQSYTPTFTAFGTATNIEFQWRRVGSDVEIRGKFTLGVTTGSEARITLPPGLTSADTTRIPSIQIVGYGVKNNNTTTQYAILQEPSVAYHTLGTQSLATSGLTKSIGTDIGSTGQLFSYFAKIPIQGWSSSVQTSDTNDSRVCAAIITGDPASASSANPIIVPTIGFDSHGGYSVTTGRYTVSVPGLYVMFGSLQSASAATTLSIYKNAALSQLAGNLDSNGEATFNGMVQCVAGDIIDIRPGGTVDATNMALNIQRVSGPTAISANESVVASYSVSANFAASTTVPINFDLREFDSHLAVTPSATAWRFTPPTPGVYQVEMLLAYTTGSTVSTFIYKNGSAYKYISQSPAVNVAESSVTQLRLVAGDYIDIRPGISATASGGTLSGSSVSHISIVKVGN